jgi:hypothetical protein
MSSVLDIIKSAAKLLPGGEFVFDATVAGAKGAIEDANWAAGELARTGRRIAGAPGEISGATFGAGLGAVSGFLFGSLSGAGISQRLSAPHEIFPQAIRVADQEEVFSVYNIGKGVFDQTTEFINLQVDMFDFDGQWVGLQTGVHVNTTPPESLPVKLFEIPPPPSDPIDQLPVPHLVRSEWTKGLFTFADGSSIIAQGPAWTHLIPQKDGSFLFMVTTSQVISKGTGLFEGVRGIKQGTGTTYVAPGLFPGKFPSPGFQFEAKVIDTFRLIRKGFLNSPAISG